MAIVTVSRRRHPADKGRQRGEMDQRRIKRGGAVGDAPIARAPALGRLHQPHHFGQEGLARRRRRLDQQRAGQVDHAGPHRVAGRHRLRRALAGHQRHVDIGPSLQDAPVHRHPVSGRDPQPHAGLDLIEQQEPRLSVGADHRRPAGRHPRQPADGHARAFAHHMVERAADQEEKQQRHRSVEIGVLAVIDRLVEAQPVGQRHTERDRHVHVHAPVLERAPGRSVKNAAGEKQRRHRDQRRQPVEQVARRPVRARPDRNRQQHDVTGRKPGNGQRTHQLRQGLVLAGRAVVAQMRGVAEAVERVHDRRLRVVAPAHPHPLGRQVDARLLHAVEPAKRGFDRVDAAAAMDRRHG